MVLVNGYGITMAGKQAIELSQLPIQQLQQLSQQLDQEIEMFTQSLNQLKIAQTKFLESQESLVKVSPDNLSKEILMYVPGQLSDVQNVLVDIGTGYFVEMEVEKGKDYFKRKIDFLSKQMDKIQPIAQEKYKMKQVVIDMLQLKLQQLQQSQQGGGASTSAAVKS
ncbi:hypothetical protein KUTeg_015306 [Tegillarca granosa]|uniref:Prefoldin subunit 5 n=1 Tax=Tegillarca granosa TaxID=220873 RepID=A0ABQ9EPQ9_TEGGR|nr:hypothetical protein KUTeg_015306 [Tegillarca granosa]